LDHSRQRPFCRMPKHQKRLRRSRSKINQTYREIREVVSQLKKLLTKEQVEAIRYQLNVQISAIEFLYAEIKQDLARTRTLMNSLEPYSDTAQFHHPQQSHIFELDNNQSLLTNNNHDHNKQSLLTTNTTRSTNNQQSFLSFIYDSQTSAQNPLNPNK